MEPDDTNGEWIKIALKHFEDARPFLPMYCHLIASAVFPIIAGAHASLSRPSSAAKPRRPSKRSAEHDEDDIDSDHEDDIQKMEGLQTSDAIILPITAGLVLAGLYFLITKYGAAELINLIMGYYFAAVGVYSVGVLVSDTVKTFCSFTFPEYIAKDGVVWTVRPRDRLLVAIDEPTSTSTGPDSPNPFLVPAIPALKSVAWSIRAALKQQYSLTIFLRTLVDVRAKFTLPVLISALFSLGAIVWATFVSKPWFLTNLQGFAVCYSALQFLSPTSFATGSLVLGAMFFYDIWAVFYTPLMVTVAQNLDQPIKLVFPRPDEPSEIPGEPPIQRYSMLGLGDIVLPGIIIGLALRYDLYTYYRRKQMNPTDKVKKTKGNPKKSPYVRVTGRWGDRFWTSWCKSHLLPEAVRESTFPKPAFTAALTGYVLGLITTLVVMSVFNHAQPALLYLVPGVLTSLWLSGAWRGELREMWEYSEAVTGEQLAEDGDGNQRVSKGLFADFWEELTGKASEQSNNKGDRTAPKASPRGASSGELKTPSVMTSRAIKEGKDDDTIVAFKISLATRTSRTKTSTVTSRNQPPQRSSSPPRESNDAAFTPRRSTRRANVTT